MAMPTDERSLADLFVELTSESRTLVSQEIRLAKAELQEKVRTIQRGLIILAVGGSILLLAVQVLIAAMVLGLSQVWAPWLAALVPGVLLLIVGAVMVARGRARLTEPTLPQTRASLKEDQQWVKAQMD